LDVVSQDDPRRQVVEGFIAGVYRDHFDASVASWAPTLVTLSHGGRLVAGLMIDRTPPAQPQRRLTLNFLPEVLRNFRIIRADRTLTMTVIGLAFFWGLG